MRLTLGTPTPAALALGLRDLYLGLAGAVLTTLPASALLFGTRELVKAHMTMANGVDAATSTILARCEEAGTLPQPAQLPAYQQLSASLAGSAVAALVRVPGDVVKHRVQAYIYPDVWTAARDLLATGGPRALFSGFGATLARDLPETAIQFAIYDMLRAIDPDGSGSPAGAAMAGALAGMGACVATTPVDVVKSQLQVNSGRTSPFAVASSIMASRGMAGFWVGCGPRVGQNTIQSAVMFALFEVLMKPRAPCTSPCTSRPAVAVELRKVGADGRARCGCPRIHTLPRHNALVEAQAPMALPLADSRHSGSSSRSLGCRMRLGGPPSWPASTHHPAHTVSHRMGSSTCPRLCPTSGLMQSHRIPDCETGGIVRHRVPAGHACAHQTSCKSRGDEGLGNGYCCNDLTRGSSFGSSVGGGCSRIGAASGLADHGPRLVRGASFSSSCSSLVSMWAGGGGCSSSQYHGSLLSPALLVDPGLALALLDADCDQGFGFNAKVLHADVTGS
jgi:hypothetical protein